ncbi:MAG: 5-carboxymethyl-2-hydroxymuconate Delta-isomerase [Bacteroidales bacterium]
MPHFVVDCSENVLNHKPSPEIMQAIYDVAVSSGLFATAGVGGIKVRINPFKDFVVVDSNNDFVHVVAHILEGRTPEQKKSLSAGVVERLKALLPEVTHISMHIQDIEKAGFCNQTMA